MTTMLNEILGTDEFDRIEGTDAGDFIRGLDGDDNINGGAGDDVIIGDAGVDRILGGDGNDLIVDLSGEDTNTGGDGDDILIGGRVVNGDAGDDVFISTGAAAEVIVIGSEGADTYFGSDNSAESYSYVQRFLESDPANPDVIYNFQRGQDTFDFSGEQAAVVFIGDAEFSASDDFVTEARFENGLLEMDLDGDQMADLAFELVGVDELTVDDIVGATAAQVDPPAEELPFVEVFGNIGTDTFTGSDEVIEVYRYNFFADDSPADAPDVIENFQPGQDGFFFGELITRVEYLEDAEFSGDADPLLGIEARFEDGRLEIDEDSDAVADKVIILEGVETLTAEEFFI